MVGSGLFTPRFCGVFLLLTCLLWLQPVWSTPLPADIDESSGLARSLITPDRLWTHNDTHPIAGGDEQADAVLFALNQSAKLAGRLLLTGVPQRDFESIDSLIMANQPTLVIADSGDNLLIWEDYRLLFVPEPETVESDTRVRPTAVLRYQFADGQSRDVEAIAAEGGRNNLWLISKRPMPAEVFRLDLSMATAIPEQGAIADHLKTAPVHHAEKAGKLGNLAPTSALRWLIDPLIGEQVNRVTGMDLHPDGQLMAVLTYAGVYYFEREPEQSWGEALQSPPGHSQPLPGIRQWEGIAFNQAADAVWISREGHGEDGLISLPLPDHYANDALTPQQNP